MPEIPEHHTAAGWAKRPRRLQEFVVTKVQDSADHLTITGDHGWTFNRSKADLGRDISVGDSLAIETVQLSQITGLRDANGWLFHLTDQDLADEARQFSEDLHRKDVIRLEENRNKWAAQEESLPSWLALRIKRFREGGGEKFLLSGWGYELMIARLADLIDQGRKAEAETLAAMQGASGNQWECAEALVAGKAIYGDEFGAALPAGLSPITGSADYSGL